jgi:hypothetical protein
MNLLQYLDIAKILVLGSTVKVVTYFQFCFISVQYNPYFTWNLSFFLNL